MSIDKRHALGSFKDLNHSLILVKLNDPPDPLLVSPYDKLYNFIIKHILHPFQNDEGPLMLLSPRYSIGIMFDSLLYYAFFSNTFW